MNPLNIQNLKSIEGLKNTVPNNTVPTKNSNAVDTAKTSPEDLATGFKGQFEKIHNANIAKQPVGINETSTVNPFLKTGLTQPSIQQPINSSGPSLVFSKHAVDRMKSRGIGLGPERMSRLETALTKAEGKGSKDTLVLMDENAFIMNVKNKTIVTAMDKGMLKENLFTNIDSTIIV